MSIKSTNSSIGGGTGPMQARLTTIVTTTTATINKAKTTPKSVV